MMNLEVMTIMMMTPFGFQIGCVQIDATTPNTIAPTMLGIVACVLAVVCKRMQQLPTMLGPAVHRGRIHPISLCKPCVMSVRGPNNVGRAVQTDPTLLPYASTITEQKKCWKLLAEKFDRFQTLHNNTRQYPTTCNRVCKRTQHVTSNNVGSCWSTMLRPFARSLSLLVRHKPRLDLFNSRSSCESDSWQSFSSGTQIALRTDAARSQVVCLQQLGYHDKLRIEL